MVGVLSGVVIATILENILGWKKVSRVMYGVIIVATVGVKSLIWLLMHWK